MDGRSKHVGAGICPVCGSGKVTYSDTKGEFRDEFVVFKFKCDDYGAVANEFSRILYAFTSSEKEV